MMRINMSNLSVFKFEESKEVRTMTDDRDGSVWFVLRDVLKAMGTSTPVNVAKATIEDVFGDGYNVVTPIQDSLGRTQNVTIISEPAATFLVSRSNTETGKKLNRWIHAEVIPAIRKTGSYSVPKAKELSPAELLECAEIIARTLNLNGSSLVGAMKRTVKANFPSLLTMIPDYSIDAPVISNQPSATSAEPCFSLTDLLKRNNASIGAVTANKRLIELGLLEEKERKAKNGTKKKFKCVTKAGLKYGKNVVSDQSPRETQPQWFESSFPEVLRLINNN